jgi:Tfp pilus assembly protein PilW
MSEDDERKQRALELLTQALQEAGIEERNATNIPLTFFGETAARWKKHIILLKLNSTPRACSVGVLSAQWA